MKIIRITICVSLKWELFLSHLEKLFPHFNREQVKTITTSKADYAQPVVRLNYSAIKPAFGRQLRGSTSSTMVQVYPEDRDELRD